MSRTLYVDYRNQGFWAFDVVSSVFLKYLVDAAERRLAEQHRDWLATAIELWRVNAVVSDYGLYLDEEWTPDELRVVAALSEAACDLLSQRDEITAEEISSWLMFEDMAVDPRDHRSLHTACVIRFGRALIELLSDSLPEAPPGMCWFFGLEDEPSTFAT